MAEQDCARVLVIVAADAVDRDIVVTSIRQAPRSAARVVATVRTAGRLTHARDQLDGILTVLDELEIPASGTIGAKDADPLAVADAELETWAADEVLLLIDASESTATWEHEVARHAVLRHGTPIAVLHGTAEDRTAA